MDAVGEAAHQSAASAEHLGRLCPPNTSSRFRRTRADVPQAEKRVTHARENATADSPNCDDELLRSTTNATPIAIRETAVGSGVWNRLVVE